MKNVLLITSSPRGEASHSTRVATELASKIGGQTVLRELWKEPLPPIGTDFALGIHTPVEQRTEPQQAAVALSDALVEELKASDVIVIGAGMINFGLPATLKTWIDYITRSGLTFQYGEAGPVGLVTGKKVILVLASGDVALVGFFVALCRTLIVTERSVIRARRQRACQQQTQYDRVDRRHPCRRLAHHLISSCCSATYAAPNQRVTLKRAHMPRNAEHHYPTLGSAAVSMMLAAPARTAAACISVRGSSRAA